MQIPRQFIDLRGIIPVKDVLISRGFNVKNEGGNEDLLIPKYSDYNSFDANTLFNALNDAANRTEINKLINREISEPTKDSLKALFAIKGFDLDRKKYTTSFEWYIGELLVRKFSAFSHSYAVEVGDIKRNSSGTESGDFDILAVLRNTNLIYVECKSGKSCNIEQKHILKCIERALSLHCELAIMVIDDNIDESKLKWSLKGIKHPLANVSFLNKIEIKGKTDSNIYEWGNCFFISSYLNIEEQIKCVLRINEARKIFDRYITDMDEDSYSNLGYLKTEIIKL